MPPTEIVERPSRIIDIQNVDDIVYVRIAICEFELIACGHCHIFSKAPPAMILEPVDVVCADKFAVRADNLCRSVVRTAITPSTNRSVAQVTHQFVALSQDDDANLRGHAVCGSVFCGSVLRGRSFQTILFVAEMALKHQSTQRDNLRLYARTVGFSAIHIDCFCEFRVALLDECRQLSNDTHWSPKS